LKRRKKLESMVEAAELSLKLTNKVITRPQKAAP
jgi:hypothetical protein